MKIDSHRHQRARALLSGKGAGTPLQKKEAKPKPAGKDFVGKLEADGGAPRKRLDKKRRAYATGGGVEDDMPKSKKGGAKTTVNVIVAGKGDQTPPAMPLPVPPAAAAPGGAPIPPVARPPMGGPPPGTFKRGGGVKNAKYPIDSGSGGGKGRLEKAAAYKSTRPGKRGS